jgi:hypothetical protein
MPNTNTPNKIMNKIKIPWGPIRTGAFCMKYNTLGLYAKLSAELVSAVEVDVEPKLMNG